MIWLLLLVAILAFAAAYPVLVARTERSSPNRIALALLGALVWGALAYGVTGLAWLMLFDPSFLCFEACEEVDSTPGEVLATIAAAVAAVCALLMAAKMRGPLGDETAKRAPALW